MNEESISLEDRARNLNEILKNLETTAGIIGTCLVKSNGLLITSRLPRDLDHRKIGAMAATMFGAIENATSTLETNDKVYNLTIELDDYQLMIIDVGRDIIFASLIELNVNLGLIIIEIEETIRKIKNIINK